MVDKTIVTQTAMVFLKHNKPKPQPWLTLVEEAWDHNTVLNLGQPCSGKTKITVNQG